VSPGGQLANRTVKDIGFRNIYDAAVVSIHRDGNPVHKKIGSVSLQGADTLLIVAKPAFIEKFSGSSDFLFLSQVTNNEEEDIKSTWWKMILAPAVGITMIVLNALDLLSLLKGSLGAAFIVILTGCISWEQVKSAVNIPVMITICASFGLATALENTGVAHTFADNLLSITRPFGTVGLLYGVYLATALLTALLSNASAAAIMIPITFSLREEVALKAMVYIVMVGASADLSTPIGYQTNLMVWGPGGYRFIDYTKVGFPLQILLSIISVGMSYLLFTEHTDSPPSLEGGIFS
jgi:di/tricarboxylate transporter